MMVATLTHREVEMVVRALKYWRSHRDSDAVRHTDRNLTQGEFNRLLSKLGCTTSWPRGVVEDVMRDLFPT